MKTTTRRQFLRRGAALAAAGVALGPRLQGIVPQRVMRRAISVLFVLLAIAMLSVAYRKLGL